MWLALVALLVQALTAPDPAQMEKVPALGYKPVPHGFSLPAGVTMGAPSSVAVGAGGHIFVFNRGPHPLLEFDKHGAFVRSLGEGRYNRPHGMRLDRGGNIWTTDVNAHTVTKMSPGGEVLLVLGVKDRAGEWKEGAVSGLLNEPTDLAFGPTGDIFLAEGHGKGDPRVLRFDARGTLITSWGGKGTGPGEFDIAHSIAIDARGRVYVADRQNRRIQVFDVSGTFITEWKYAGLPCGLYIAPAGDLYMVSGFAGQIVRLDKDGKPLAATGEPGKGLGKFGEAHYLSFGSGGEIYVTDTINETLHKFVKQ